MVTYSPSTKRTSQKKKVIFHTSQMILNLPKIVFNMVPQELFFDELEAKNLKSQITFWYGVPKRVLLFRARATFSLRETTKYSKINPFLYRITIYQYPFVSLPTGSFVHQAFKLMRLLQHRLGLLDLH